MKVGSLPLPFSYPFTSQKGSEKKSHTALTVIHSRDYPSLVLLNGHLLSSYSHLCCLPVCRIHDSHSFSQCSCRIVSYSAGCVHYVQLISTLFLLPCFIRHSFKIFIILRFSRSSLCPCLYLLRLYIGYINIGFLKR